MPWIRARFKDAEVWAEVDDAGRPVLAGKLRSIRYRDVDGAKVYRATAAAITDEEVRVATQPEGIVAWCDGACTGNPGPAGAGALVRLPDGRELERHAALGLGTNNIGELTAVRLVLELARESGIDAPIHIYTDSKYAIGVLTQNWKAKANVPLIAALKRELAEFRVTMSWVRGHSGIAGNERADELAGKGVHESMAEMAMPSKR